VEAQEILAIVKKVQTSGTGYTPPETPLQECGLNNVDCPVCHNSGYVIVKNQDGTISAHPCECMAKRVSIRNLERSGLKDMIRRYTFDNYVADTPERIATKKAALDFCMGPYSPAWWYISGRSGSGKTHICTAICSRLMDQGKAVRYMLWRDATAELKSFVMDGEEYQERIRPLKKVAVLYIDDFLKGGCTEADLRLAFEIINARYNNMNLRTIISSERPIGDIMNLDEALGGRVYERASQYMRKAPPENWRMR